MLHRQRLENMESRPGEMKVGAGLGSMSAGPKSLGIAEVSWRHRWVHVQCRKTRGRDAVSWARFAPDTSEYASSSLLTKCLLGRISCRWQTLGAVSCLRCLLVVGFLAFEKGNL